MRSFFKLILEAFGWRVVGNAPDLKKYVIIVVPHTSNLDFFLGIAVRGAMGFKSNYLGKEILFRRPWGWIFRKLGGFPVKRDQHYNQVDQVVHLMKTQDRFVIAIAPEGTRSESKRWKTGFYWIAKKADVPIVMVSFDYGTRRVTFSKPLYPGENITDDFLKIRSFYSEVTGFNPGNYKSSTGCIPPGINEE